MVIDWRGCESRVSIRGREREKLYYTTRRSLFLGEANKIRE